MIMWVPSFPQRGWLGARLWVSLYRFGQGCAQCVAAVRRWNDPYHQLNPEGETR